MVVKSATLAPKNKPKPKVDEPSIADKISIDSSGRTEVYLLLLHL